MLPIEGDFKEEDVNSSQYSKSKSADIIQGLLRSKGFNKEHSRSYKSSVNVSR